MKVFKSKPKWTSDKTKLHLVRDFEWLRGKVGEPLLSSSITMWCDVKDTHKKAEIFEVYIKADHRKKLCEDCVKIYTAELALQLSSTQARTPVQSERHPPR